MKDANEISGLYAYRNRAELRGEMMFPPTLSLRLSLSNGGDRSANAEIDATLAADLQELVARQLKRLYGAYAAEPIPQSLLDLLRRAA